MTNSTTNGACGHWAPGCQGCCAVPRPAYVPSLELGSSPQLPAHSCTPTLEEGLGGDRGGGKRSGSVKFKMKNCAKIEERLRCRDQTSRSLKEQHFCTGDTQGTNTHARWATKKQLRKIAKKNCEKLRTSTPPIGGLKSPPTHPLRNACRLSAALRRRDHTPQHAKG